MKIRELQEQLSKLDPDISVICYSEDDNLLSKGHSFILFDISAVNSTVAERLRLKDGTPYLKFERNPGAKEIATLEVTSIF